MSIVLQSSGGGSVTLEEPVTASNYTISVPAVSGTMLTTASAGTVLQVVYGSTSVAASNSTSTYADTGLTATITPKFSTSNILVLVNQTGLLKNSGNTENGVNAQLLRGATVLLKFANNYGYTATNIVNIVGAATSSYLDSPATTSATTYKTQFANANNAASVSVQDGNSVSTITLLEIAV